MTTLRNFHRVHEHAMLGCCCAVQLLHSRTCQQKLCPDQDPAPAHAPDPAFRGSWVHLAVSHVVVGGQAHRSAVRLDHAPPPRPRFPQRIQGRRVCLTPSQAGSCFGLLGRAFSRKHLAGRTHDVLICSTREAVRTARARGSSPPHAWHAQAATALHCMSRMSALAGEAVLCAQETRRTLAHFVNRVVVGIGRLSPSV